AEAISLDQILEDYLHNHALAFAGETRALKDAGYFRFRKDGEDHGSSPELMRRLHAAIKSGDSEAFRRYEDISTTREPLAIRDLLAIDFPGGVEMESVESEQALLQRFSTQAMSVGAVSPEVHRTLALAMNRLGARSNTGEGGEDPELYSRQPEAAC